MELLEGLNEVGLKAVAYRTHPLGSSTAVQLWAPVCHQHGTVYEGDFVKNWHSPIRHTHILADR